MRYFIVTAMLIIIVLLPSCHLGSNNINPKAKREILSKYGGEYSQKVGSSNENVVVDTNISTDGNIAEATTGVYNLELKGSEVVENYSKNLWIPASNIAYLFYSNLEKADSNKNINVRIQLENGETENFVYTRVELEEIEKSIPIFEVLARKISEKNYKGILSGLKINLDVNHIKTLCGFNDSVFGEISETEYMGFTFVENQENQKTFIQLTGVNMRDLKNTPFSIFINRETQVIESFAFEF